MFPMWGSTLEEELTLVEDSNQWTREQSSMLHMCLDKKISVTKKPSAPRSERPRAVGRIFAMTTTKAT